MKLRQGGEAGLPGTSSASRAASTVAADQAVRIVASLIRACGGDFQLAEDSFQDALLIALQRWPADGVPANPDAWIMTTARRRAIDRLRRERNFSRVQEQLRYLIQLEESEVHEGGGDGIADDRLRLIFTCCHPALSMDAQVALTLRTVANLSVEEIARAFLVSTETMAKRLVRARTKIREARIPYEVPEPDEFAERLTSVLAVVYLVFNEGYTSANGSALVRAEICDEAIRLARMLIELMPDEPEVRGLAALMLLNDSRRAARVDSSGELLPLGQQDRSLWDFDKINEGLALLDAAIAKQRPGPYQIEAAIAALHAESQSPGDTDWRQIASLYRRLLAMQPSPVIRLNWAAAVGMSWGPEPALAIIDSLMSQGELDGYHLLHAVRAEMLARAGRLDEAAASYRRAIEVCNNEVESRFLSRKLAEVSERKPE